MPKVICSWMMCKYNSSQVPEVSGECMAEYIELEDIESAYSLDDCTEHKVEDAGQKCLMKIRDKSKD